jgi:hypothetical protein
MCAACGHEWSGTALEFLQAGRAEHAWAAEQVRQEAAERSRSKHEALEARLAELHEMKRKGLAS